MGPYQFGSRELKAARRAAAPDAGVGMALAASARHVPEKVAHEGLSHLCQGVAGRALRQRPLSARGSIRSVDTESQAQAAAAVTLPFGSTLHPLRRGASVATEGAGHAPPRGARPSTAPTSRRPLSAGGAGARRPQSALAPHPPSTSARPASAPRRPRSATTATSPWSSSASEQPAWSRRLQAELASGDAVGVDVGAVVCILRGLPEADAELLVDGALGAARRTGDTSLRHLCEVLLAAARALQRELADERVQAPSAPATPPEVAPSGPASELGGLLQLPPPALWEEPEQCKAAEHHVRVPAAGPRSILAYPVSRRQLPTPPPWSGAGQRTLSRLEEIDDEGEMVGNKPPSYTRRMSGIKSVRTPTSGSKESPASSCGSDDDTKSCSGSGSSSDDVADEEQADSGGRRRSRTARSRIDEIAAWADRIEASEEVANAPEVPRCPPRKRGGTLSVNVRSASGLQLVEGERGAVLHPFVRVRLGGQVQETKVSVNRTSPRWKHSATFTFAVDPEEPDQHCVHFQVLGFAGRGENKMLGSATVDIEELRLAVELRRLMLEGARTFQRQISASTARSAALIAAANLEQEAILEVMLAFEPERTPEVLILAEGDALVFRHSAASGSDGPAAAASGGQGTSEGGADPPPTGSSGGEAQPSDDGLRWRYLEQQVPALAALRYERRRARERRDAMVKNITDLADAEISSMTSITMSRRHMRLHKSNRRPADVRVVRRFWKRVRSRLGLDAARQLFNRYSRPTGAEMDSAALRNLIRCGLLLTRQEISDSDISAVAGALDEDGNGRVSLDEWLNFLEHGADACEDAIVTADQLRARELLLARFGEFFRLEALGPISDKLPSYQSASVGGEGDEGSAGSQ